MIISCVICNKKFEVMPSLIPDTGRNIKCGSCHHTWFFKPTSEAPDLLDQKIDKNININFIKEGKKNHNLYEEKKESLIVDKQDLPKKFEIIKTSKVKKIINLGIILSYLVVCIISFIALIIILDTFKSPLNNVFPNLEILLYNLFETVKDMILFFKDLFI
jgi:predicted Zn finger-like uncharacterized protein